MSRMLISAPLLCLLFCYAVFAQDDMAATFVDYWNAGGDRAEMNDELFTEAFMARNGEDGLAELMNMLYSESGAIAIESESTSDSEDIHFLVSSDKGNWLSISLQVSAGGRIDRLGVDFASPPPGDDEIGLDDEQIISRLEKYLDVLTERDEFSGAVMLARNFVPLFTRAYGLADRQDKQPNTPDTPMNLGSMNKMFTGVAIAQLVSRGKLSYDDTVGKHLPDYPNEKVRNEVTIHQLLTHTSGLGSYWNELYSERRHSLKTQSDFAELFANDPLAFEPGTNEQYSNAGPVVLGLIIEAVSGMDYYQFIRENIYTTAGMTHSDHYDKFENISGKATGYFVPEGGSERLSNFEDLGRIGSAAGGGYASVNDLLKFAEALYDGTLVNEAQRETITSYKVQWGEDEGYGYLFGDQRINGKRYIGHNGGAPGINAEFSHFPELGYTLIVLSNLDAAATPVAGQVRTWIAHSKQ